jgi:hypothetical protein
MCRSIELVIDGDVVHNVRWQPSTGWMKHQHHLRVAGGSLVCALATDCWHASAVVWLHASAACVRPEHTHTVTLCSVLVHISYTHYRHG